MYATIDADELKVRTGMLYKKGKRGLVFGRANWKPRFFVLTSKALRYYASATGSLKGVVDLTACGPHDIQAMPQDCPKTGTSSASIWRIAIQTPTRRFFLAAQTSHDMDAWVHDLVEVTTHGLGCRVEEVEHDITVRRRHAMR
ncbi:hypothetical protein H257_01635 [Aphanomyces astaci]|uniref:PH domain-containing protein n=1 Tax=Aphanomyces astaci TaxID=112090 RepID=W4H337_APHAT|nr:hypothetical protein H257_01635 [Aphanomyces astaci]ETV86440.1 hypothetical protein H257_01635 [Aphanomyces astaci]RQM29852.1 hypothetical protein B5M09_012277 [Aphanomyces astaci]|eukprot:XP_009823239.1 hypothetical protein H257_01635 [Aphanomyces astaci]